VITVVIVIVGIKVVVVIVVVVVVLSPADTSPPFPRLIPHNVSVFIDLVRRSSTRVRW